MSVDNLRERLGAQQEQWERVGPAPDGTYQALVNRFDFFESDKSGDAFLKTEFQIEHDEEHAGKTIESIHNLTQPDRLEWLHQHLERLGLQVPNLAELEDYLQGALDVPVEIELKTNEGSDGKLYQNVYVNKRLGDPIRQRTDVPADTEGLPAEGKQAARPGGDDDIPF
jgi:hypothetical protein